MFVVQLAVMFFVAAIIVFALYGLIRPFTHIRYRHTQRKLWGPLD